MIYVKKLSSSLMVLCLFLTGISLISADTLRSNQYTLQFGTFNTTSGEKSGSNYTMTDTVGQTSPGEYDGAGYVVKSGFQYIYPFKSLSLRISKTTIDLGILTPGTFNTDSHTIIVDTNGAGGYAVKASESHPLRLQSGSTTIRDTLCDSGTCTESTASSWTNANNYGFGFNVSGTDASADFSTTNYFRQFADLSAAESMQTVMSGTGISLNSHATVTYKAAPAGNQTAGLYETLVRYTLIATY